MTILLASLAALLAAGYPLTVLVVLRHLRDRDNADRATRAATQASHEAMIRGLADQVREAYQSRADEVADLLQRIQAPQQAVIDHSVKDQPAPAATYPLSDEESAERAEAIRRIEELERQGLALPEVIG